MLLVLTRMLLRLMPMLLLLRYVLLRVLVVVVGEVAVAFKDLFPCCHHAYGVVVVL